MKKILFHTRQAGSASALIPVVNQLKEKGFSVLILCEAESINLWRSSGLNYIETSSFIKDVLDDYSPDFIVTGTSLKVEQDAKYWNWAHVNSIPCLAYLESWVNYKQRFSVLKDFDRLPKTIGVADELILKRLKAEGLTKNIVKIIPHPRFDELLKEYKEKRTSIEKEPIISIFTNPLDITSGNKIDKSRINSQDFLLEIINSLEKVNSKIKLNSKIYIKFHPRENKEDYLHLLKKTNLNIEVTSLNSTEIIHNSKLVIGFNSIVLLDSSFLNIPTIAYQPNKLNAICDITHKRENLIVIKKYNKLEECLKKIIKQKPINKNINTEKVNNSNLFTEFIISNI